MSRRRATVPTYLFPSRQEIAQRASELCQRHHADSQGADYLRMAEEELLQRAARRAVGLWRGWTTVRQQ